MAALPAALSADAGVGPKAYQLDVRIDPDVGQIGVSGWVSLSGAEPGKPLAFSLHGTFTVERLAVADQPVPFVATPNELAPLAPCTQRIALTVPPNASTNPLRIEMSYHGVLRHFPEWASQPDQKVGLDDQIGPGLVELASYSNWYPSFGWGHRFDAVLDISLPSGWTAVALGQPDAPTAVGARSVSRWHAPAVEDIVVLAAPNFHKLEVKSAGGVFEVYHTRLPESFVHQEVAGVRESLAWLEQTLGQPVTKTGAFRYVYSPRRKGQNFARTGLVVDSEGRVAQTLQEHPDADFFQLNAHEVAHFWWRIGRGQADWINEASAEYFALLSLKTRSAARFNEAILKYRQEAAELPPTAPSLATVPANSTGQNYVIRYRKGALLLHDLSRQVGEPTFLHLSRLFYERFREGGCTTEDFRQFWLSQPGIDAQSLNQWLDVDGPPPAR